MQQRALTGAADGRLPARRRPAMVDAYLRHRFAWLFGSLLLTLAVGSTLERLAPRHNVMALLLAVNLVAAIASVARERDMRIPLALGGGFVLTRGVLALRGVPGMLALSEGLWVMAIVLATVTSVRHAFARGAVDAERLLAALDAYLLAGLLFGVAYAMLDRAWPASFGGAASQGLDLSHGIYFSFVTIATLGYGDVIPVSEPARGLALVEGVSGQMYLAVLVARLVSLYSQQSRD